MEDFSKLFLPCLRHARIVKSYSNISKPLRNGDYELGKQTFHSKFEIPH